MQPITLPAPSPGKHTIRVPLDPQPHPGIISFLVLRNGEFKPIWSEPYHEMMANNDCLIAPYKPGETYWVREPLRGVIDTAFTAGETMPICGYATGERDHIWTKDQAREPWRWGKRTTIPAEEMPREFSRFTARCLSVNLEHGEGWEWVVSFEVTNNTRSE